MNQSDFDVIFTEQQTVVHANWLNGANCTLNSIANVRNFGACGDNVTDDTVAIQTALATGLPTYFPETTAGYKVTSALLLTTKGQLVFGDNRFTSVIKIGSDFNLVGQTGVFVANCGEEGPCIRDLGIDFAQPDTTARGSLINYPPALYLRDTPRFTLYSLRIACAMTAIDMKGNSGGAFLDTLELSAFNVHIDIDGSLDTVRLTNIHCWNFGVGGSQMTANQLTIYKDGSTLGLRVGTCDDLIMEGVLFISDGPQMYMFAGVNGTGPFGTATNCDFDSNASLVCDVGQMTFSSCFFSSANSARQVVVQTKGWLKFVNCEFEAAAVQTNPMLQIVTGSSTIGETPLMQISNCLFRLGLDMTIVQGEQTSGNCVIMMNNCAVYNAPNVAFTKPMIWIKAGCRAVLTGNYISDKGTGAGTFIKIDVDDNHVVTGNEFTGWSAVFPTQINGLYAQNTSLPDPFLTSGYLGGQTQYKRLQGNLDGSGNVTVAHGIASAQLKVIFAQGWYKGGAGEMVALPITVDGTNVIGTGGVAARAYRITLEFTPSSGAW